jgi:hypothetical protein
MRRSIIWTGIIDGRASFCEKYRTKLKFAGSGEYSPVRSGPSGGLLILLRRKAARETNSMRSTPSNKGLVIMDYERMSNAELYALLKQKMPAVTETVGKVRDSNRETVIAFLRFVQTKQDNGV